MSKLKTVELEGFELQQGDLDDLLPDATQEEMESIAYILTDYLMEEWHSCLTEAVRIVKGDRDE